ncbi:MAG: PSD1 and planctomycete cytochrome C domain-containing protein [Pirellulaceae bacterium]|jgi:hypothetical protein|nr:PSD1 and planctomycete cytochrome C domain-containing protein [Pirellulaceae bacterium]MDP7016591.1 PSD1 and planctomycete cytochrome C domain-containing protein [Pirellulaceae bacterium]
MQRTLLLIAAILSTTTAFADEKGNRFFEEKIRPLLADKCYKCHGPEEQESNLRLDSWEGIERGGDTAEDLLGDPAEKGLLMAAVKYELDDLQMPPEEKLDDDEIALLLRWLKMGAPHPDRDGKPSSSPTLDWKKARDFWSLRKPVAVSPPAVKQTAWPRTAIDHFVLAKLEAAGLEPAPAADRTIWLRRVTFDLTGLPPSRDEIDAFLSDESPDAFGRVVARLLASPRYGIRWGRHWLDVVRYADSNGLDENIAHGNAWRYRDYIVDSFNGDKPFDRLIVEQLAGDLIPAEHESARREQLIATGYLSLGPKVLAEGDVKKMEMDIIDEQLKTIGSSFLGQTFGCARCHHHKFDPIRMEDYYALAGILKSTKTMESFKRIARWNENSLATSSDLERKKAHEAKVAAKQGEIDSLIEAQRKLLAAQGVKLAEKKEDRDKQEAQFADDAKKQLVELRKQLQALQTSVPPMPTAMGVGEGEVADLAVHIRGSHLSLGKVVNRRFPLALAGERQKPLPKDASGRRQLAEWLVSADNPLTARVLVNRVWRWHFGQGLSRSPDNFGRLGAKPSHPQLLDWLAVTMQRDQWSLKRLHTTIVLSSTYQMSSQYVSASHEVDAENVLLWRFPIRRLEAEAVRDSLLYAGGKLDESMGGSLLHVENRKFFFDHTSKDTTNYDSRRRSIYLPVVRNHMYDVFTLFDYADASMPRGNRSTTTIAPQALFMMNSALVRDAAAGLADRCLAAGDSAEDRVKTLYNLALARDPDEAEIERIRTLLSDVRRLESAGAAATDNRAAAESSAGSASEPADAKQSSPEWMAWRTICQVCLASNEFVYVR